MGRMKIDERWYLIRGSRSASLVRKLWVGFREKYPDNRMTMLEWAVGYGMLSVCLDRAERKRSMEVE